MVIMVIVAVLVGRSADISSAPVSCCPFCPFFIPKGLRWRWLADFWQPGLGQHVSEVLHCRRASLQGIVACHGAHPLLGAMTWTGRSSQQQRKRLGVEFNQLHIAIDCQRSLVILHILPARFVMICPPVRVAVTRRPRLVSKGLARGQSSSLRAVAA